MRRSADLDKAKTLLACGTYTCVLVRGDLVLTTTERGVKPLLMWLERKEELRGGMAADRVVGKAAAFLYALLGVDAVYAPVMSEPAVSLLVSYGIEPLHEITVPAIRNRAGTGLCPMEQAVYHAETPAQALREIQDTLAALQTENRK